MIRVLLVLALFAPTAPESDADPQALGATAFSEGRYDEAAEHFAEAFERDEGTGTLYDWAQAERLAGRCEQAADLYGQFVERWEPEPPSTVNVADAVWAAYLENAKQQREACLEAIAAAQPEPEPEPEPEAEPEPEPEPQPEPEPEPRLETPVIDDAPDRSWRRDPTGITLLSIGSAATAAGAALLVSAELTRRTAEDADVHQDQRDGLTRASRLQLAGFVTLPVGVALAVGGAIRLGVLARKQRRVAVSLDPLRLGVTVRGHFSLRPFVLR